MEGLNYMLKVANLNGWIRGFQANHWEDNMKIPQLLYTDDTLLFCDAEVDQLRYVRLILTLFEVAWGLVCCFQSMKWRKIKFRLAF